jgi:hypothetical protein
LDDIIESFESLAKLAQTAQFDHFQPTNMHKAVTVTHSLDGSFSPPHTVGDELAIPRNPPVQDSVSERYQSILQVISETQAKIDLLKSDNSDNNTVVRTVPSHRPHPTSSTDSPPCPEPFPDEDVVQAKPPVKPTPKATVMNNRRLDFSLSLFECAK